MKKNKHKITKYWYQISVILYLNCLNFPFILKKFTHLFLAILVAASRDYSSLRCEAFMAVGFSCCGALTLGTQVSVVAVCQLSSCGTWA